MYKAIIMTLLLVGLVPLAGCGSKAESLLKQQVADMNRLADAIESGKSQAVIDEVAKSMAATMEELDSLKLSSEEKAKLGNKYAQELMQASKRLMATQVKKMGAEMPKMPQMPKMPKMPQIPGGTSP